MRLHDIEERYRRIIDTSHDVIWSVDSDGRITFVNRASRRLFGREPDEMLGHRFTEFLPSDTATPEMETLLRRLASGEEWPGTRAASVARTEASSWCRRMRRRCVTTRAGSSARSALD